MTRTLGGMMRTLTWAGVLCGCLAGFSFADEADAAIRHITHIEAQKLGGALKQLAKEQHFQILFRSDLVRDVDSAGAVGDLTVDEALSQVLSGTGLTYRYLDATTITIQRAGAPETPRIEAPAQDTPAHEPPPTGDSSPTGASASLRLAELDPSGQKSPTPSVTTPNPTAATVSLGEIIVTAQKRIERLQDVPVPVTALDAQALADSNEVKLQDYYSSVPGLSLTSQGIGDVTLAIRGITTGYATNPSVGITIDDVPYGTSSILTNASLYLPDLDPSDLQRIEVLRGPQGTLYGASSIGGLLKFVTLDPSMSALTGRVQVDLDGVQHGDGLGYGVRASVNIPLGTELALRASGFVRQDPGYIDNPLYDLQGVNRSETEGGHFALLWRPSDAFSAKLSALLQDTRAKGTTEVLASGGLEQDTLPGSGAYTLSVRLYSANITGHIAGLDITSITGYGINRATTGGDLSALYGGPGNFADSLYGVTGAVGGTLAQTEKLTQELRVSSSIGHYLDWLVGGFYTHENSPTQQPIDAASATTGVPVGELANFNFPSVFDEAAAFADLTVHFTDRFDIQLGGRESHNHQVYNETDSGPIIPTLFGISQTALVYPTERASDSALTYLATPKFKFSEDLMAYARFASGYRPGGPNADAILFGFPGNYGADKTYNYELGLKGNALERTVSFDASLYYIDWKNIQISLYSPSGFFFFSNAGSAKSQGVELSAEARPLPGLTVSGWVSWDDAVLTSNFPPTTSAVGAAGDRLPYSSRFSGNLAAKEERTLSAHATGFISADVSYIGARDGTFNSIFTPSTPRPVFPAYAKTDFKLGVRYDTWTVTAFINNLTDRRGVLSNVPSLTGYVNYIQPRAAGLSIAKEF